VVDSRRDRGEFKVSTIYVSNIDGPNEASRREVEGHYRMLNKERCCPFGMSNYTGRHLLIGESLSSFSKRHRWRRASVIGR
jgi:hypothetical protein